jgi:hypothetical protein
MAKKILNIGTVPNDGTGDSLRVGADKINSNFEELYNIAAPGAAGASGDSAYDVALANGFVGTEAQWLTSLEGLDGADGAVGGTGPAGSDGTNGTNGTNGATGATGDAGADGSDGADGTNGTNGIDGIDGIDAVITKAAVEAVLIGTIVSHNHETATEKPTAARNTVLNQDPVFQGKSSRAGFSATIYTGDGAASLPVATNVDMSTGDLAGLVIKKNRDTTDSWIWTDTVRGATIRLSSDSTAAEVTDTDTLTAFSATGFTVGADVKVNTNTEDYVAWSFQTDKKETGVTNRNKAYTAHYNADMGFSIVGYVGDGVDGHEIPHHLGRTPELSIYKNRDSVLDWFVQSSLFGLGDYLRLSTTAALATATSLESIPSDTTIAIGTNAGINESASNIISYHFTSISGVSKIGKYIGTGATGNYVDCGFKPAFVMVKNLTNTGAWIIFDAIRDTGTYRRYLLPNSNVAETEQVSLDLDFVDNGFTSIGTATNSTYNTVNDEYLFLAFAETALTGTYTSTDYEYPTTADTLSIAEDTNLSFAQGFDTDGQADSQEIVGAAVTHALGAGFEDTHYWLYKDLAGSYDVTENRPLTGLTRNDADKWGVVSPLDATLRTTTIHSDYESETGVALASSEFSTAYEAYEAFWDRDVDTSTGSRWASTASLPAWLQYKQTEKRILKSWRIRSVDNNTQDPKRFVIEGSNDGLNWSEIDVTYKVTTGIDYAGNGNELWGDLQSTSGNTTAYLYHRIYITSVNGSTLASIAELEFNTILPSDYYLVEEGVIYDSTATAIERVYLAELMTDSDGDVIWYENLSIAQQRFTNVEVHNDEVYGPGWDSSLEVATKNAIYDKIEAILAILAVSETVVKRSGIAATTISTAEIKESTIVLAIPVTWNTYDVEINFSGSIDELTSSSDTIINIKFRAGNGTTGTNIAFTQTRLGTASPNDLVQISLFGWQQGLTATGNITWSLTSKVNANSGDYNLEAGEWQVRAFRTS